MIDKFRSLIENFSEYWILCIAIEIGILELINKSPGNISGTIQEHNWNKDLIEALCNCLTSYGYLEKEDVSYKLTEMSKKYLLKESPDYIGYFAESARVFNTLSRFTDYIVHDTQIDIKEMDWLAVTKISALTGEKLPEFIFEKLPYLRHSACSILDVGSGRMKESMKMAELNLQMRITGIEPNRKIIDETSTELVKRGLDERIRIIEGDVRELEIDQKFDVIMMNHLLHCLPHEVNVTMLKKLRNLLVNGGYIIVFDDLLNDDRTSPKESVKKNLLVKLLNSKIYPVSELKELLQSTGFDEVDCHKYENRRIIAIGKRGMKT